MSDLQIPPVRLERLILRWPSLRDLPGCGSGASCLRTGVNRVRPPDVTPSSAGWYQRAATPRKLWPTLSSSRRLFHQWRQQFGEGRRGPGAPSIGVCWSGAVKTESIGPMSLRLKRRIPRAWRRFDSPPGHWRIQGIGAVVSESLRSIGQIGGGGSSPGRNPASSSVVLCRGGGRRLPQGRCAGRLPPCLRSPKAAGRSVQASPRRNFRRCQTHG